MACLVGFLLGATAISWLDAAREAPRDIYLQPGTPTPMASRLLAAPEPAGGRPPLARVARPEVQPTGVTRPGPRATPSGAERPSNSIDGSGSGAGSGSGGTAGTKVGTVGGATDTGPSGAEGLPPAQLEAAAVRLTNQERTRRGCAPLRVDSRLTRSARAHSRDMAAKGYFDHTSPQGTTPWQRMARAGYSNSAAENIARGYSSAEETVRGWMNNAGHRRNILNCQISTVGVGVAYGGGDTWWTQDFGYS
ncbi:CAP domain-containing protein [Sphaerisporangium aureirubrum]|uniref:CAP domain-containing protein n=1 Tax=Sphaerisporangium aureirubrum TaxID=1544736 RepID=A0ABW1NVI4_9ACTN